MTKTALRIHSRLHFSELSAELARIVDAPRDSQDERGAIYTKREVVDFMLDAAGYDKSVRLFDVRVLEPSFGNGDFLFPLIDRLLHSWKRHNPTRGPSPSDLSQAIYAVELHAKTFTATFEHVEKYLAKQHFSPADAHSLTASWLHRGDFLLHPLRAGFDYVFGNPPYVRQELIPPQLMAEYRRLYSTIFDRADLYIPFIERSLSLLNPGGAVTFICSDRWTKNRYGRPLRELVSANYHLKYFVDMVDTPAFHSDVVAYPGIFVIANSRGTKTRVARRPNIKAAELSSLSKALRSKTSKRSARIREISHVAAGGEPWILDNLDRLAIIRQIEGEHPTLEEAGCSVRIGVATGADKIFVAPFKELDVEPSRKLPLVMTRDISSGEVKWKGLGVINPFGDDGHLVPLSKFPRLARYLNTHGKEIRKRHVAANNPHGWYRTIDRIYPEYCYKPKLLIPDIKGEAHVVYEKGTLYPHHNLYYVTSASWDLRALQAVLLSQVTRAFIGTYSTQMRGGFLRYQAQYLRRIRLPHWDSVAATLRARLRRAAEKRDIAACNRAAQDLYRLSDSQFSALQEQTTF